MRRIQHSLLFKALIGYLALTSLFVEPAEAETLNSPNLTFAVMSDIHIHAHNTDVHRRLTKALEDYRRINPNMRLIVINGDLTNGFPSHYSVLERLLDSVPHPPIHFTPGNHDFYKMLYNRQGKLDFDHLPNGWSSEEAMRLFQKFTGYDRPYHDVWVDGYHFVFLASEKSRDADRSIGKNGYLSDTQLNWLEEKLKERPLGTHKPTFVFFHHPLPNTVEGSEGEAQIVQHRALRRILDRHPEVIFFSGHTHYSLRKTNQVFADRFFMLGSSSIMRHEESLYIEVYDDHVDIHSRDHGRGEWIRDKFVRHDLHTD